MRTDISFEQTHQFSSLFQDYINQKEELKPFYNYYPDPENFGRIIAEKKFPDSSRQVLYKSLLNQYHHSSLTEKVQQNLEMLLDPNTYTVTTGHQLCLFTGPVYFIYKIITTINLAKELHQKYPDKNFVPVFWMASEDHDFEEVNHFYFNNKKFEWPSSQKGPVGRFNTNELNSLLGDFPDVHELFHVAYQNHPTLASATRYLVNELFGKYGLVILDGDDPALKRLLVPALKKDLFENLAFKSVNDCSEKLKIQGYKIQVNAREINFFYIKDGLRERIEKSGDRYVVTNTDLAFSKSDIENEIDQHPENFSPNVIIRPLYQETILPNIAYVGGPGEIAYWLQLKSFFEAQQVPFPILMPRNFVLLINHVEKQKLAKWKLDTADLFEDDFNLKIRYLKKNVPSFGNAIEEEKGVLQIFNDLKAKAAEIDKTLVAHVEAQEKAALKILRKVDVKFRKALERKEKEGIESLLQLKEKLFPGGGLQERRDNFLNFYLNNPDLVETLLHELKPFDFRFNILQSGN